MSRIATFGLKAARRLHCVLWSLTGGVSSQPASVTAMPACATPTTASASVPPRASKETTASCKYYAWSLCSPKHSTLPPLTLYSSYSSVHFTLTQPWPLQTSPPFHCWNKCFFRLFPKIDAWIPADALDWTLYPLSSPYLFSQYFHFSFSFFSGVN